MTFDEAVDQKLITAPKGKKVIDDDLLYVFVAPANREDREKYVEYVQTIYDRTRDYSKINDAMAKQFSTNNQFVVVGLIDEGIMGIVCDVLVNI